MQKKNFQSHTNSNRVKNNFKNQKYDIGDGKKATLEEIMDLTNLPYATIYARIRKGYRGKQLLNSNLRKSVGTFGKKYEVKGEQLTVPEIAKKYHLPAITVYRRVESGYTGEQLIQKNLKKL